MYGRKQRYSRSNRIQGVAKACTDFPRQELGRLHTKRLVGLSNTVHVYNSWPSLFVISYCSSTVVVLAKWQGKDKKSGNPKSWDLPIWGNVMFAYELQRRLPALDLVISHVSIKSLVVAVDGWQLLFHLNGLETIRHSETFRQGFFSPAVCKTNAMVELLHSWKFHGALLSGIRSITSHKSKTRCNKTPN